MSRSWGKKLEKKLNGLTDTASKESIQTLSNWIAFNRKNILTIVTILTKALQDCKNNDKRQWLYWQIIHEILVRDKENASKWEKLAELRLALGEAIQPSMKILGSCVPDQLDSYLEEWEDLDVFGGPSVNAQIRRLFHNRKNAKSASGDSHKTKASGVTKGSSTANNTDALNDPSAPSISDPTKSADEKATSSSEIGEKEQSKNDNEPDIAIHPVDDNHDSDTEHGARAQQSGKNPLEAADAKSPSDEKPNSSLKEQIEYDFERKGVPSGPVESREFFDPCKAITTLQIARDIRTNTAVEISTALSNLPADILSACEDLHSEKLQELDTAMTNEFSIRIPSSLIDLDLAEEASSLNMFQDIVLRQQKAREKLIYLLLRSRCQFGSKEAAQEFYDIDNLSENLKRRKEALSDALELEGLDTSEIGNENKSSKAKKRDHEQTLSPLSWYKPDDSTKTRKLV